MSQDSNLKEKTKKKSTKVGKPWPASRSRKMSEEHKAKISEAHKKAFANGRVSGKLGTKWSEYTKELQREMKIGSKNWSYQAFVLIADTPNKGKLEYVFDGNTPAQDCYEMFGVSTNTVAYLKGGGTVELKRVSTRARHPWPKKTTLKIKLIK